jgi:hypothetical protein
MCNICQNGIQNSFLFLLYHFHNFILVFHSEYLLNSISVNVVFDKIKASYRKFSKKKIIFWDCNRLKKPMIIKFC